MCLKNDLSRLSAHYYNHRKYQHKILSKYIIKRISSGAPVHVSPWSILFTCYELNKPYSNASLLRQYPLGPGEMSPKNPKGEKAGLLMISHPETILGNSLNMQRILTVLHLKKSILSSIRSPQKMLKCIFFNIVRFLLYSKLKALTITVI